MKTEAEEAIQKEKDEFIEKMGMITRWDDVTLDKFIKLAAIEVDEELARTPLRRSLERVIVLTGKPEEELLDLPGSEFGHLIEASKFTDEEPATLFEEKATFEIDGVTYGYRKPGELSTGEYISLEVTIADANRTKSSALPGILGVLIRPVVETESKEFGKMTEIEKFDNKTYHLRVQRFKKELRVPFFIHALNRITTGEQGISEVARSFLSKGTTTRKGRK